MYVCVCVCVCTYACVSLSSVSLYVLILGMGYMCVADSYTMCVLRTYECTVCVCSFPSCLSLV